MIQKLIILGLVIAAVWYGFRFVTRLDRRRKQKLAEKDRDAVDNIADTEKCPVCDTYIAAELARDCGKPGCPHRSG